MFDDLHPNLQEHLLHGSVGKTHLAGAALAALSPECARPDLGIMLLVEAWAHDPLDSGLAAQILALDAKLHLAPGPVKALLAQAAKADKRLQPMSEAVATAHEDGSERDLLLLAGQVEPILPFAAHVLRARGHFLGGRYERAAQACRSAEAPLAAWQSFLAECLLRQGERAAAIEQYRAVVAAHPWHVTALMRLYDLAEERDRDSAPLDGDAVILLYSWNKAAELDATLESLAASDTGQARIIALDNGSTDDTPQVLEAWAHRLGERFDTVRLPSNIGAPAARNWLMTLPEVRASRWTAYLDDDIILPPDWLSRLGAATRAYPGAGVWGCKIVDRDNPVLIQNADLHLRSAHEDSPLKHFTGAPPGFEMTDLHYQSPDLGQFDSTRPCASVTGCCHLFRTSRLLEAGEFDIRFSPTQFDDLEHDLRLVLAGHTPVYTGHLTVRHARLSGARAEVRGAASGNAFGNSAKLHTKIGPERSRKLRTLALATLLDDARTKQQALGL